MLVPASAPTAAPSAAAVPTAYGVRLAEAAEKVSNAIAMGTRGGVSVARIELSPQSLGAIQIHLQHTSDGLIARVVTDHPEAAQTLSQGGDELKRQLQQNGTVLLRLDIESSGHQGSGSRSRPDRRRARPARARPPAPSPPMRTQSAMRRQRPPQTHPFTPLRAQRS